MKISVLLISGFFFSACAYLSFSEAPRERNSITTQSDRGILLQQAEKFYEKKEYAAAEPIYVRLSRFNEGAYDPIYDQALWRLSKIYEKNNQSEKAVLSLDELATRRTNHIAKNRIRFALMKNHYRISNFVIAAKIDNQIYEDFKSRSISLSDLSKYLLEMTDLGYDSHLPEELLFLGEVQKYFVFIMESNIFPENENLTEHLVTNYEHFFSILNQGALSDELKKRLAISLFDQLNKFKKYTLADADSNPKTVLRFSDYCEKKQKLLVERFYK